jgi:uncharacterized protein YlxW (UPF0749 family)
MTVDGRNTRLADGPPPGPPGLLTQLLSTNADPDYAVAAAGRGNANGPASRSGSVWLMAALAVFGVLLGVSIVQTERDRPQALVERAHLIAAIHAQERHLDALHTTLRTEQVQVAGLQTRLTTLSSSNARLRQVASILGMSAGAVPTSGPGLVVTVNNAATSVPGSGGVIRDSDLQALVNGLWTAGAEAVAINGHRLTALTAIRYAGQAITVDYKSLTPPYVVEAVGNPDALPARFLETQGAQLWLGLKSNFGVTFQTRTAERLELPGDPRDSLLWAHPRASR